MTLQKISSVQLIFVFILMLHHSVSAQNIDSLHHLVFEKYGATMNFSIEYSANDFYLVKAKNKSADDRSYEQIQVLKDSLEITGDRAFMLRIGQLYSRLNETTLGKEWFLKALTEYSKAYVSDPNSQKMLKEMVSLHTEMGQTTKAIEKTNRILELSPKDLDYILLNTVFHFMIAKYDDGVQIIDKAAIFYPEDPGLVLMKTMGEVFKLMGALTQESEADKAKVIWANHIHDDNYLNEMKSKFPDNETLQIGISCSELFILFYGKILPIMFELPDDMINYNFNLSDDEQKKLASLEKSFKSFLKNKSNENTYALHYSLGMIKMLQSDFKKAIPNFKKAIDQKPVQFRSSMDKVISGYDNIIASYLFLDDKKSAEKALQTKIDEHAGGDPSAVDHLQLAYVKIENHDLKSATMLLETALGLDSNNVDIYTTLGDIYLLEKKYPDAENLFNLAYDLSPDDKGLYLSLIGLYIANGEIENAVYMANSYLEFDPENEFVLGVKRCYVSSEKPTNKIEK